MKFMRVLLLAVGLFGLLILIAGLVSAAKGGIVALPGFGLVVGGFFLVIVGLAIGGGAFVLFFLTRRR